MVAAARDAPPIMSEALMMVGERPGIAFGVPFAAMRQTWRCCWQFRCWHKGEAFNSRSDSVRYVRYFCRADEATAMPLDDRPLAAQVACLH